MNELKLSIVIPAYNEENHIEACLTSIAAQTEKPDEVIVVDNGSTDRTRQIVSKFDFVTLLNEPRRGVIAAEVTGFRAATGQLIGRFNADVVLAPDWVARAKHDFALDPALAALAGVGRTKFLPPLEFGYTIFWSWVYLLSAEAFFKTVTLWGANMVLRQSAWAVIEDDFARSDPTKVHDDQDLSLHLAAHGLKISRDNRLVVKTREHSYYFWPKLYEYIVRRWQTKRLHIEAGTYQTPDFPKISWFGRFWRYLVCALPIIIFVVTSPLAYPFIWSYQRLRDWTYSRHPR